MTASSEKVLFSTKYSTRGFTLIEILVALALFGILASITSGAMYYAFNARTKVSAQADQLNRLQLALSLIEQDFNQTIPRSIYGNDFHLFPAFIGRTDYVEFTRGGLPNPNHAAQQSTLQRVALLCQKSRLLRRTWPALDTPDREHFQDQILLDHLKKCDFAFLDKQLKRREEWDGMPQTPSSKNAATPKAIQLNFTLAQWGKASFLFMTPLAVYHHV